MINARQLRDYIIDPSLEAVDLYSPAASQLLMGTAAQESALGAYVKQVSGPALGIFQMEPATHSDIWNNYLVYRIPLGSKISDATSSSYMVGSAESLIWNLRYAAIMARVQYLRVPKALPELNNIDGLASYWKKWYNTPLGRGTESEFRANYKKYVGNLYA